MGEVNEKQLEQVRLMLRASPDNLLLKVNELMDEELKRRRLR